MVIAYVFVELPLKYDRRLPQNVLLIKLAYIYIYHKVLLLLGQLIKTIYYRYVYNILLSKKGRLEITIRENI